MDNPLGSKADLIMIGLDKQCRVSHPDFIDPVVQGYCFGALAHICACLTSGDQHLVKWANEVVEKLISGVVTE